MLSRGRVGARSMRVPFGKPAHFHGIPVALENGTTFGKFDSFLYRIRFYDAIAAEGLFKSAEGAIGNDVLMVYYAAIIEKQAVTAYKFILRRYTADPVHRLFHPDLHLLRRGYPGAIGMSENQHEFVHFLSFYGFENKDLQPQNKWGEGNWTGLT
jgi:hypothetical protein